MSCSISTWSSRALAALPLALCLAASTACGGALDGEKPSAGGSAGRAAAPDFALRDLSGRTVRLSDHRGKVVLVNFWATWCVPCAAELPHLERLYNKYRDQGFVVLAISMDGPESSANVDPHARRYGLTFPVLLDEETRVVATYNPKRTAPFTVMIGRGGEVAGTREGYHAGDEIAVEEDIRALIANESR
ncbi:MAG TPA: TlpA disulfide reductase family protein [Kofleriaceae bacterium]|nr:TlpA disulfide reductase family protein [Kofleriaceae bacterium]